MHMITHDANDTGLPGVWRTGATDRRQQHHRELFERRFNTEFEEVPGLTLTPAQAARLFGVSVEICQRILRRLADQGTVVLRSDKRYVNHRSRRQR